MEDKKLPEYEEPKISSFTNEERHKESGSSLIDHVRRNNAFYYVAEDQRKEVRKHAV